jgi:hypothetical protein
MLKLIRKLELDWTDVLVYGGCWTAATLGIIHLWMIR